MLAGIAAFSPATRSLSMKTPVSTHESRDRALESRASAIDTAAAHWLARLTSGETSAAERSEFDRWRRADPAHEAALAALRDLWSGIGVSLQQIGRAHV